MKSKDKILVASVALLIASWLFPPTNESPRYYATNREVPREFDGFHFIFSSDPYSKIRVLKTNWGKLLMLNLVIFGAGGTAYFLASKKG